MSLNLGAGATLRQYRVITLLGRGGMGEVYAADDTKLGRKVAIKILPATLADDPERLRRFTQEAKAASALNHPSILTIYDVDSPCGSSGCRWPRSARSRDRSRRLSRARWHLMVTTRQRRLRASGCRGLLGREHGDRESGRTRTGPQSGDQP